MEWSLMSSKEVVMLIIEVFTSLICFVMMALQDGFTSEWGLQFLMAMGIIVWIVSFMLALCYLLGSVTFSALYEFVTYVTLGTLTFTAFVIAAWEIPDLDIDTTKFYVRFSVAMGFFTSLELIISSLFAYQNHQNGLGMGMSGDNGGLSTMPPSTGNPDPLVYE